ncbi:coniferyl aldehyde dehydrogenase [Hylemonella gracilis str. Niagara R]|uniref:Aldehyde dehydrogenase n=1 Tax=Hylemonella gracilis str. Niagara R TaxID=1458275 RepID=A0A016XFS5_9BURK|nr:coniferyl aldehyde dehydrogenase [Hylemonella gracilis]EYC50681.1 coniferyl aldehyde dehydrogenase [Hylemonella gracilis str. Niagara R]
MTVTPPKLLQAALQTQRDAYLADPVPSYARRLADLKQLERFVREQQEAICAAISADYGHRSRHETLVTEVLPTLHAIHHARKHLKRWMRPQRRGIDRLAFGLAGNRVIPQPLGVVGVIVPWNFPLNLSLVPLSAILAAGNRAMVKMSENSRHLAALMMRELPRYFPANQLQVFDETGGVGIEFSKLPFDHLLFTGSGQTGKAVMAAAAANLCPVTLELGGKSPAIVLDDFPLRTAAERLVYVKFLNAGQICTTVDHAYVPRARVEEFVRLAREIVAQRYPALDTPDYTSIIDARAYTRLKNAMDEAQARGAQLIPLIPGPAFDEAKHRIAPHLLLNAPADCELMLREIFGPILPVIAYDDLETEVIQRVNAGPRPLALYPFTNDKAQQEKLLTRIMSGGVSLNDALFHVAQDELPFGGVGASGMGHYHGFEGFLTFSKLRPVFMQARFSTAALLAPPYGKLANRLLKFLLR